eukprot:1450738-Pleurochrysis_carterae.AAC.1
MTDKEKGNREKRTDTRLCTRTRTHVCTGAQHARAHAFAISQILAERRAKDSGEAQVLVKWAGLSISSSTWEDARVLLDHSVALEAFKAAAASPVVPPTESVAAVRPKKLAPLKASPLFENGRSLRPYQLEGVNWMLGAWHKRRNVLLADEMGLGKTAQCVATISLLHSKHKVRLRSRAWGLKRKVGLWYASTSTRHGGASGNRG